MNAQPKSAVTPNNELRATSGFRVTPNNELRLSEIEIIKRFSGICWGEFGSWTVEEWQRLNTAYFDDALKPGGIVWGLTPHGKSRGSYAPWANVITLHKSIIEPHSPAPWKIEAYKLNKKFASDVLLHEMIHQKIHQAKLHVSDKETSHNNEHWAAEIVRISKLLGIEIKAQKVKQRRFDGKVCWRPRKGYMSRIEMATWPHSIRPPEYYGVTPC